MTKIHAKVNSELQKVDFKILKIFYCFFPLCDHKFTLNYRQIFKAKRESLEFIHLNVNKKQARSA